MRGGGRAGLHMWGAWVGGSAPCMQGPPGAASFHPCIKGCGRQAATASLLKTRAGQAFEASRGRAPTHTSERFFKVLELARRYGAGVVSIDKDAKTVRLSDGSALRYGALITTMPLDVTLRWLGQPEWAAGLQHSSSHFVGVGIRGPW